MVGTRRSWWILPTVLLGVFAVLLWQVVAHGPLTRFDIHVRDAIQRQATSSGLHWLGPIGRGCADLGDQQPALLSLLVAVALATWRVRASRTDSSDTDSGDTTSGDSGTAATSSHATRSGVMGREVASGGDAASGGGGGRGEFLAFLARPILRPALFTIGAGIVLATVIPLKIWVGRPGPGEVTLGNAVLGFFPSGHTADAVCCYVPAAFLLGTYVWTGRLARRVLTSLAVGLLVLTIFGLLWSNYHWLSDILGSLCWCGAWLLVLRQAST